MRSATNRCAYLSIAPDIRNGAQDVVYGDEKPCSEILIREIRFVHDWELLRREQRQHAVIEPIVVIGDPERIPTTNTTRAFDEIDVHDATLASPEQGLRDATTRILLVHDKHDSIGMKPSGKGVEEYVHAIEHDSGEHPWYTYYKEPHSGNDTHDAAPEH